MKTKLFLVFFQDHTDAQFLTSTEIEVRIFCDGLKEIGASYVPLQLCVN